MTLSFQADSANSIIPSFFAPVIFCSLVSRFPFLLHCSLVLGFAILNFDDIAAHHTIVFFFVAQLAYSFVADSNIAFQLGSNCAQYPPVLCTHIYMCITMLRVSNRQSARNCRGSPYSTLPSLIKYCTAELNRDLDGKYEASTS